MKRRRVQAIVAAELSRVLGVVVPPGAVVVDCESTDLAFVGVPGFGDIAGRNLHGALRNALRFIERWVAAGNPSIAEEPLTPTPGAWTCPSSMPPPSQPR